MNTRLFNYSEDSIWIFMMQLGKKYGCHQIPERSFTYHNRQFPVCARCTGVIISTIVAYLVFPHKKTPMWICSIMAGLMIADGAVQYYGIKESTNSKRLVTGLLGGFWHYNYQIKHTARLMA